MPNKPYSTHDPFGNTVFLYDDIYNKHIKDRHPEAEVEYILRVIENPDFITNDVTFSDRQNYYKRGVVPDTPRALLKVCIEISGDSREIVTAYEAMGTKPKEKILWKQ